MVMLLPAGATELAPAEASPRLVSITLAEANASGATAQAGDPVPAERQGELAPESPPDAATPPPAPSPWAGTLELYGFTPLRATTSITRAATERDLSGLFGNRGGERNRGQLARRILEKRDQLPDLSFPNRGKGLRDRLAQRRLPDEIEIPGFTAVTDVGLGTILEHLTDVFFLRGSLEHNRVGFQTDLSYVGLGGQTARDVQRRRRLFPNLPVPKRTLKTEVAVTQGIYDFALRYRFGARERAISTPGALTVIPYAGVRVVDLGAETTSTFEGPLALRSRDFSFGNPIAQPLLGLQGQVFVTPRMRLFARGDLGGFGANGAVDMSGNAQAGVGYAIGNSTQLDLSWRYLYLARDNGQSSSTSYTIDQNGIEVGVKFFF